MAKDTGKAAWTIRVALGFTRRSRRSGGSIIAVCRRISAAAA